MEIKEEEQSKTKKQFTAKTNTTVKRIRTFLPIKTQE
jgi:hypothetical protein